MDEITYQVWYESLVKPAFAPPAEVFGIAWGIIYPLIFLALFWVLYSYFKKGAVSKETLSIFAANLIFNVLFSPIQLALRNNLLSSVMILVILGSLLYLEYRLWRESKVAFWLLVPYVLWGTFATVLQIAITLYN